MFVAIRHGQRADQTNDKEEKARQELQYDPHLTKRGELQALATGEYLREVLSSYKEDNGLDSLEVVLVCSPFLRTIMTA